MVLFLSAATLLSAQPERIADLRGRWHFNTGDDADWSSPDFDHASWSTIFVPGAWEDEGYPGYDGYAWYRITVPPDPRFATMRITFEAGRIDDCDQVFINGTLIGATGGFPPMYFTAFNRFRSYAVPQGLLSAEKPNTIAIRVFDEKLYGGILEGKTGLYGIPLDDHETQDLSGKWKLQLGDNPDWKEEDFDDSNWQEVTVPLFWDAQGHARYDGIGWYRKTFVFSGDVTKKRFLRMGRIDDFDEVYLNGVLVGKTGDIPEPGERPVYRNEYQVDRLYALPDELLRTGKNLIAVRVFDGGHDGGIYAGPVLLTTNKTIGNTTVYQPEPIRFETGKNWWERFLNWLFNTILKIFGK
jgi:sialate O-acetylesterase